MALQLKINVKREKHRNTRAILTKYKKDFKDVLKKVGVEGVKNIEHEIKKRNLTETEDLVSFEVLPQGLSFTIDYEKAEKSSDTKAPEKLTGKELLEEEPETINKVLQTSSQKSIKQGVTKGLKTTKDYLIKEIRKLNTKIIANA